MSISNAFLTVGSLSLDYVVDVIDPAIMKLFRPSDRRIRRIDQRDRDTLAEYIRDDMIDDFDEGNPLTCVEYRCSVQIAKDRLDVMGFTVEVGEAIFKQEMPREIQRYEESLKFYGVPSLRVHYDDLMDTMRSLTIEDWHIAMQRIREENLGRLTWDEAQSKFSQQPVLRYMLNYTHGKYGFPGYDPRPFIRLAIDKAPAQDEVSYDLTEFVLGEVYGESADDVIAEAEMLMQTDFLEAHRVIVLTEGRSDIEFLERSLRILYPHLADYFHFFDFTRNEGGAGRLVSLVRAFAAADVRHRILAMFDNDTGAREALVNFDTSSLPDNIAVAHFPNLSLAKSYPTLGPTGETEMDINGLAGSLEMYLGKDVLEDEDGILTPVQWTGYSPKMNTYQGEVLGKGAIQEKFRQKLNACEARPENIEYYDWEGIRAIVDVMRTAFGEIGTRAR